MKLIKQNESEFFNEAKTLVEGLGYKLVDFSLVQLKTGWNAYAVIFSPKGVGIEDCTRVHKPLQQRLQVLLNVQELFLEVSSPGMRRVLKKAYEFEAFIGEKLSVWDLTCTDWVTGILIEYNGKSIVLETEKNKREITLENCKKARLE